MDWLSPPLPDRFPDLPGTELAATYLPGADTTDDSRGDWYDVLALPGGAVGLAIGDVVGRGTSAAMLVGRLRSGVREYASEGLGPAGVLCRVNALVTDVRREMSTLLLLAYEPATGRLRGANAGHPPALIRRADGSVTRWDVQRGLPLGVVARAEYGEGAVELEDGDVVVLFTDGLIERRGMPVGEALDRLEAAVPALGDAAEVRTAVLDAMLAGDDDGHDDDVAVLALGVRDTAGQPLPG